MADYYFKMDDMAVGYQGQTLIHDINIGIDKGEIVTLIGPNGSGKSTILKSITKQLKLIGGKVFFDDTSLQEMSYKELSSNMAVVLTERIKTELMTCHEIVATGRYPYTGRLGILTPEDEQIVDEAMKAVHAEDLGNRDFNAISDGQKQRVLLAGAGDYCAGGADIFFRCTIYIRITCNIGTYGKKKAYYSHYVAA